MTKAFAKESKGPYVGLVGNKTDLSHSRVVSREKHNQFADENDAYSYFMSAKTGDMVQSCLYRVAADLAGVVLTKSETDVNQAVIGAHIVDHQRHDETETRPAKIRGNEARCTVS